MNREERKKLTLELADLVRELLQKVKIEANVRCHFYRNSTCMVIVRPKSKEYKALNHWEQQSLCEGLVYWLNQWLQYDFETGNPERYKVLMTAAKIYGG